MPNILFDKHRGLADSIWSGEEGSYAKAVGVDFHSKPGALTVHQALAKHSGATIDELCKVAVAVSDGSKLWFSSTSGKIWRESSGTYTLKHTTTPGAGGAACLGAFEFNGRIYWATESRVHYITVANVAGDWAANAQEDAHTFSNTDDTYHPMAVVNNELFIGDKIYVASIDSAFSFTANSLDIVAPHRIRVLLANDIDLLIGTYVSENINYCQLLSWDTSSDSWQIAVNVLHNGIRAGGFAGNIPIFIVGSAGRIMYFDGAALKPWKRFPGSWSSSAYYDVNPQSIAQMDDRAFFGLSNGSGNPIDQGIYDIGSYSSDYRPVISLSHPISEVVFSSITIGAILADGLTLYVAWQNGTSFGVDKLDATAKYTSAYVESRAVQLSVHSNQPTNKVFANYQNLNSGDLSFSFKENHETSYNALTSKDDTNINQVTAEDVIDARVVQLKMAFTVSGNNAPVVELWGVQATPAYASDAIK